MSLLVSSNPLLSVLQPQMSAVAPQQPILNSLGTSSLFAASTPISSFAPTQAPQQNFVQTLLKLMLFQKLLSTFQNLFGKKEDSNVTVDDRTPAEDIPDIDYRDLSKSERTDLSGLTDRERAVLHLWGRQMIANGQQDGGILLTVQEAAKQGDSGDNGSVIVENTELQLANELTAKDKAEYGGVTGKSLDEEFFKVFKKITGKDISAKYADAPVHFATGPAKLPEGMTVDSDEWENALEDQNGLSSFENSVLRLWGHNPVFTGKIDGSILAFTLSNDKALDSGMDKDNVQALMDADMASDGVLNGDSLETSFADVMDKLYLGKEGATVEKTKADALKRAERLGRTAADIKESTTTGVQDAIKQVTQMFKDHPILLTTGAGGLAAALAICPFLAGMGAGGAAIALGQNMLKSN